MILHPKNREPPIFFRNFKQLSFSLEFEIRTPISTQSCKESPSTFQNCQAPVIDSLILIYRRSTGQSYRANHPVRSHALSQKHSADNSRRTLAVSYYTNSLITSGSALSARVSHLNLSSLQSYHLHI